VQGDNRSGQDWLRHRRIAIHSDRLCDRLEPCRIAEKTRGDSLRRRRDLESPTAGGIAGTDRPISYAEIAALRASPPDLTGPNRLRRRTQPIQWTLLQVESIQHGETTIVRYSVSTTLDSR